MPSKKMKTEQDRLYLPDRIRVAFKLAAESKDVAAQTIMKEEKIKSMYCVKH